MTNNLLLSQKQIPWTVSLKILIFYKQKFVNNFLRALNTCVSRKCFCGIQKTDLQFNENSQGNLKQEEFLYLQLLVHSYEIYYVWQNVLYRIFMLYKVVLHFNQLCFFPFYCSNKNLNWKECMQQDNSIYIHMLFLLFTNFLFSWFHNCECLERLGRRKSP